MSSLAPPQVEAPALPSLPLRLSAGDLRGAGGCLAKDACLLTPDGTAVHGREAVRRVLAQLIAADLRVEVEVSRVLVAGDTALARERWSVSSNGVDGERAAGRPRPHPDLAADRRRLEADGPGPLGLGTAAWVTDEAVS